MNVLKELWNKRHTPKGRVDITFFFGNIFLLFCHLLLMIIYIIIGHGCMIGINIISTVVYLLQIKSCYKRTDIFVPLAFFDIWLHMIFAVLSFGWTPCFQNWAFALIAAYFLPTYSFDEEKKSKLQSIIFTVIIIVTYFILSILIHVANIPIAVTLSSNMNRVLFTINNLFAFIAITMFAIFYTSSSKRKQYELTRKADYDELTDLYNRHAITQLSRSLVGEETSRKKYNAAIIDIDFFKLVNDKYGHNSGDMVLKEIAKILKSHNKKIIPSRWGGEEFVVISTTEVPYAEFKKLMESLRVKISKHKFEIVDKKNINITVSIGITKVKKNDILNDAIKVADKNLYKAKKAGRNRVIS